MGCHLANLFAVLAKHVDESADNPQGKKPAGWCPACDTAMPYVHEEGEYQCDCGFTEKCISTITCVDKSTPPVNYLRVHVGRNANLVRINERCPANQVVAVTNQLYSAIGDNIESLRRQIPEIDRIVAATATKYASSGCSHQEDTRTKCLAAIFFYTAFEFSYPLKRSDVTAFLNLKDKFNTGVTKVASLVREGKLNLNINVGGYKPFIRRYSRDVLNILPDRCRDSAWFIEDLARRVVEKCDDSSCLIGFRQHTSSRCAGAVFLVVCAMNKKTDAPWQGYLPDKTAIERIFNIKKSTFLAFAKSVAANRNLFREVFADYGLQAPKLRWIA